MLIKRSEIMELIGEDHGTEVTEEHIIRWTIATYGSTHPGKSVGVHWEALDTEADIEAFNGDDMVIINVEIEG